VFDNTAVPVFIRLIPPRVKVAIEEVKAEQTMAQLAAPYEVDPGQIRAWKKSLLEGAAGVFNGSHDNRQKADEALVARLYKPIGQLKVERDFLEERFRSMSRERRREIVDREHRALSTVRQCASMGISRSSVCHRSRGHSQKDLAVMKLIDQLYLTTPFDGSGRMNVWLDREGYPANRKLVRRLADHGTTGHLLAALDQQTSAGP